MSTPTRSPEFQRLNAILTDFLQSNHTLVEIANLHDMTVLELLEWSQQPKVKEVLDAVYTLSRQRIRTIRAEARITSLRRLDLIAATSDHEETARRAAMGLLRGSSPRRKRMPPTLPGPHGEIAASSADNAAPATRNAISDTGAAITNNGAAISNNGAATVKERPMPQAPLQAAPDQTASLAPTSPRQNVDVPSTAAKSSATAPSSPAEISIPAKQARPPANGPAPASLLSPANSRNTSHPPPVSPMGSTAVPTGKPVCPGSPPA